MLLWPITSYLVTNITVTFFWFYFFVLNRTTVIGRENVGNHRNTLLLSNHQSMIDSFLVGLAAYYPQSLLKPYLIPWNPAAVENFYKTPLLAWLADNWKCMPVRPGRRDMRALYRMTEVLPKSVMIVFPEGTRTRDGSVAEGRPGAGLIALATKARVIPVAIRGMNQVLPIGKVIPRVLKQIQVYYGEPIDYSDLFDKRRTKETAQLVVDRAIDAIRKQQDELVTISADS
jgi:1-acyl-sn-glycerol-3-phosphate acyltransferase